MTRSLRLRRWQSQALEALDAKDSKDFLVVATPGAGKTTFALAAAIGHLAKFPDRRVVIVAPTSHLKSQWAAAAAKLGLQLEPAWSSKTATLPSDMHGIIVTYQQVAANPQALRQLSTRCIVVFDELHHAGEERAWGDALRLAFDDAPQRLALSGTPFRSDTHAIPFVTYVADEAVADFDYGYKAALTDRRVVRPVYFPTVGGWMEWADTDGNVTAASFDDALDLVRASQRLRTALSLEGSWLPSVIGQANDRLMELRALQPDAAGLIIATDQDHARDIVAHIRAHHGVTATIATSDDPSASDRIAEFAAGKGAWLVAVRMVSEGVDIPRLRVGIWATSISTELYFRQAVGRLVRHSGGPAATERAWLFIPDDYRLRRCATTITEERRHSLRKNWEEGDRYESDADPTAFDELGEDDGPGSLFEVLSSAADETSELAAWDEAHGDDDVDTTVAFDLPAPPALLAASSVDAADHRPLAVRKRDLRTRNSELAKRLALRHGRTQKDVNWHLNQAVGIAKVAEATTDQLVLRAEQAQNWLNA